MARDLLLENNPVARVETHPMAADWETEAQVRDLIQRADLVVCATDSRMSKLFINRLCIQEGTPALYGGAFRRAYGGQVLRVRPQKSPCYQCFVLAMPEDEADKEISSQEQAASLAYSDRAVPIEPGLSIDVAPISLMVARLALQELLAGRESTLHILDADFAAPWYLWLNRPEPGSRYADMPPLSDSRDDMTILRWYGVFLDREEGCPICGDFIAAVKRQYDVVLEEMPSLPEAPPDAPRLSRKV